MNIVVAIDSFKGSLTSIQAGTAVKEAVLELNKEHEVIIRPLADGGEGTVDALSEGLGGEMCTVGVKGPLCEMVEAKYCILEDSVTAVMEMSAAAGITLVPEEKRNPFFTTTYGVGEMILDAISKGCRRFIIGIGGSATNDGGVGMLQALGYEFMDEDGNAIPFGAIGLEKLYSISDEHICSELSECEFRIACDVRNPLSGPNGCSVVYGPQKGADADMIQQMDCWLEKYAKLSMNIAEKANPEYPGCGAAGGLGFAFMAYLNARLEPGVDIILEETGLEEYIKNTDIVVTGEGRLDEQTAMGKAPIGVAKLAKKYGKMVIAFAGCVSDCAGVCNREGIDAYFPILREVSTLEDAMNVEKAFQNLKNTAGQVFRLIEMERMLH